MDSTLETLGAPDGAALKRKQRQIILCLVWTTMSGPKSGGDDASASPERVAPRAVLRDCQALNTPDRLATIGGMELLVAGARPTRFMASRLTFGSGGLCVVRSAIDSVALGATRSLRCRPLTP